MNSEGAVRAHESLPAGTRRGTHAPGVLLLLCQCCQDGKDKPRQILAEIRQGKLTIDEKVHGERHYLVLGRDIVERLEEPRKLRCVCCDDAETAPRIMAECQDGLLIIRFRRFDEVHFVALTPQRLEALLASTLTRAYHEDHKRIHGGPY